MLLILFCLWQIPRRGAPLTGSVWRIRTTPDPMFPALTTEGGTINESGQPLASLRPIKSFTCVSIFAIRNSATGF